MRLRRGLLFSGLLAAAALVIGNPFPPFWQGGSGPAVHYQPVAWPSEPVHPADCGVNCGEWLPYTRFSHSINDPRVQDPSNGGTAPQNYVNVSSSCSDGAKPSIYYHLHKDALDPARDVLMFRWRVEQPAHNYATGPSAGNFGSSSPWSSALWTVLFDVDGSGYRSLAAHLNGSSGSPSEPVDILAGVWGETPTQSLDYVNDGQVHLLGHNPTAVIGPGGKILNFGGSLTPTESWPNGASETSWDYGTTRARRVSTSPCSEYFIDYQIPVAMLDATAVGGPKITRDKPISMLFCTANSLNNPFQKDCAINKRWLASVATPAPFGDYVSFDKDEPYRQPIVSSVTAQAPTSCPASHKLTAKVQDVLALDNGVVAPSVQAVDFYYWYDRDADGEAGAGDSGSAWTRITPTATLQSQTLNTWTADWNAGSLPKGRYLIGVQALDDPAAVDNGMTPASVGHRTFSYLSGDTQNEIYVAGVWETGQQAQFPAHSPAQAPTSAEDWYGNPTATGNQVAVVAAINACGLAPTITLGAAPASVAVAGTTELTITIANPAANSTAITLDSLVANLPAGFTYASGTSSGATSADPAVAGQQLTWTLNTPLSIARGASTSLTFDAVAGSVAGSYNATAGATTSFGSLSSSPVAIVVDAPRVSLSSTPSAYSVAADGATPVTFTFAYANDSAVAVSSATIVAAVPAGATYASCTGGTQCSESSGSVTYTLGSLSAGAAGSVNLTLTVPNSWTTPSLTVSTALSAAAPDSSLLGANASSTVAVTGLAANTSPALRLTKTASAASIAPGGTVTFTLAYENYGTGSASAVVLTDTLPTGLSYVSCSGVCNQSGSTVTWDLGTVAGGATGSRTVTVTAANPFTATNPAVNSASIAWSGGAGATAEASVGVTGQACSVYYFRNTTANVGFDGSQRIASPTPVPVAGDAGSSVTQTAPVSGAAFLEVLRFYQDPQTQNDVPFNGDITTNIYIDRANGQGLNIRATVYDYNATTGVKTQLAQNTTLFNGSAKGLLSFAVTPTGTLAKGHRLLWVYEARSNHNSQTVQVQFQFAGTVSNAISGGATFANSNAQYCVTPPANLTLADRVDTASIAENTTPTLEYTLNYANAGSATATNLSLVGSLPTGSGSCEYSTNRTVWSACSGATSHTFSIASLAGGATGTAYVRGAAPSTAGPATLTGSATLASDQTNQVSALATTAVTSSAVAGTPALSMNLVANRSYALPGQSVTYTATVVNVGDGSASNVIASNVLPATAYYTYAGCTGGCSNGAGTLTWPTIATLAPGASQTYTYTMTVASSGVPAGVTTITDDVAASGNGGLTVTSNVASVSINGNPSLQAQFSASPANALQPDDPVVYTLSIANSGAAQANGVAIEATVPANTTFVSSPTGTFDPLGNRVVFDVGTLASAGDTSVAFTVRVNNPLDSGTTLLTSNASVSASNAAQQSLSAMASASAAPDLIITNDAPGSVPLPSAVLTAAVAGRTLFVDRSDRFALGQLIRVDNDVAAITSLGPNTVTVDSPINAASGTAVLGAVKLSIVYRNDGNAHATGVSVREALPSGLAYHSSEPGATSSPIAGNSGDVDWSIGAVNAGSGGTLEVITFPTGATGVFTSTATITAANAVTRTADAVTVIGGLSVTKATSTPVLSAGDAATYSIVAVNSLATSVLVSVTDVLPEGFSYQDGSAVVGGSALEPTFDGDDDMHVRPNWTGVSVPANGALTISFKADVAADAGATAYQNELHVDAPPTVAVMGFDPLTSTQEDVTVLAATQGLLRGHVFRRVGTGTGAFDAAADTPLAGVRVEIHKPVYDCVAGTDCFVVYTDGAGSFTRVVEAGNWMVSVVSGTGELDAAWAQVIGANDDTVTVAAGASALDDNGYRALGAMYLVSTNAGAGGSISPTSESVEDGMTAAFTITPSTSYEIDSVTGCGGALNGNTFTTAQITADCTVNAAFKLLTYAVTASAGNGGSITPPSSQVNHGATTSFSVTPATGYDIASVSGCGGSLSGNTYTTGAITGSCAVTANFAIRTYAVTASAGNGGSITPPSSQVNHGATASFSVTPATGYDIASVSGCGGALSGTTYTTSAITASCAVNATFTVNSHAVTTMAGTGGSITPASTSVQDGETATFTVTANVGYSIVGVTGCSGTLSGATYTTGAVTADCTVAATFLLQGPSIATPPPARMDARSLFTSVPLSLAPEAIDGAGAPLPVTLVGGSLQLLPGRHTITWRAEDASGRVVTVDQQLDIWPTVSLSHDLVLEYGASGSFSVLLNGSAPVYPYTVEFAVGGDGFGTKHSLAAGSVTFESGTEAAVTFDTLPQAGSPPDEQLTVKLDPSLNIGGRGALNIRLRAINLAPQVSIVASQADRTGTLIAKNGGTVTLHAVVDDPNPADAHTFQWTYPPKALPQISVDGFELSFDPDLLDAGLLSFAVTAMDNGNPPLGAQGGSMLALRAAAPVLGGGDANGNGITDAVEGWTDSGNGIPAYLNRLTARNVLPENAPVVDAYLIESESGIRLRVGAAAQLGGDGGARLGSTTIPTAIAMDSIENVGGYFSFEAHELAEAGAMVRFVIPQRAPIPAQPSYRLWDEQAARWVSFAEDSGNTLESAPGTPGHCPAADSDAYTRGLTPGHLCVRITVADGGVNDLDHRQNKSILSTGGVGGLPQVVVTGVSSGSSGGGGAMNGLWLAMLGVMALARRRRMVAVLVAAALASSAATAADRSADESRSGWWLGADAMFVRGSVDADDMDARLASQGYETQTQLSGQARRGGAFAVGYRLRRAGVEAAYVDLGRLTTRVAGTTPVSDEYLLAISRSHPQSGSGAQFSVLGYWPLGERLELVGRAGAFYWRSNMSATGRGEFEEVDDRALDPVLGLGLSYRFNDRWTAGVQAVEYRLAGERIASFSCGVSFRLRGRAAR